MEEKNYLSQIELPNGTELYIEDSNLLNLSNNLLEIKPKNFYLYKAIETDPGEGDENGLAHTGTQDQHISHVIEVDVIPNQIYQISGSARNSYVYWAFYGARSEVGKKGPLKLTSQKSYGSTSIKDYEVTAPAEASYLHVSYIPFETFEEAKVYQKLNAVMFTEQNLSEEQKAQVRKNIGATTINEVIAALPRYTGKEDI